MDWLVCHWWGFGINALIGGQSKSTTIGSGVCRLCTGGVPEMLGREESCEAWCLVAKEFELLFHEGDLWGLAAAVLYLGKRAWLIGWHGGSVAR